MDVHPTKNGINKYWSIPIWKNKTCSKPPTRIDLLCNFSRSDVSLIKDQVNAKTDANPLSIRLALAASSGSGGEVTLCRSSLTSTWKVMENAHLIPSRLSQSRKLWAKNVVNHSCQGNGTRKLKLEGFEIHPSWNMIDKTHKTQLQHMCHFHIGTTYWAHTHTSCHRNAPNHFQQNIQQVINQIPCVGHFTYICKRMTFRRTSPIFLLDTPAVPRLLFVMAQNS